LTVQVLFLEVHHILNLAIGFLAR